MAFSPDLKLWKWIETNHWEVQFHGLPPRVPWLDGDDMPPTELNAGGNGVEFPVLRLFEAVEAYLADDTVVEKDPRFTGFQRHIDLGKDFVTAIEGGDLIAAMGVMREMDRAEHPCGYLEFNRAFLLGRNGDATGAREAYRRGTQLAPECEMLWAHYARTSEAAGDRAESVRAWFECIRILPRHQQAVAALEKAGELFVFRNPANLDELGVLTKEQMRANYAAELENNLGKPAALRALGTKLLMKNIFENIALDALGKALAAEPDDADLLRHYAVALRVNGEPAKSLTALALAAQIEPENAWAHFHMAEAHAAMRQFDKATEKLNESLRLDPNLAPALEIGFLANSTLADEQKEDALAAFAVQRGAWRPYLFAADNAWKRGARERAVKFAAEANKLAPDEQDVFFTYTGMLSEAGEHEWVAALTRPRIGDGQKNPRAWMNYARALRAMGLHDEAAQTLRDALARLRFKTPEERGEFDNLLAEWTGGIATAEVDAETHPSTDVLKRSVFLIKNGKRNGKVFEAGMGTPNKRVITVLLDKPVDEFDLLLEQHNIEEPYEAHNLGAFTVGGYDRAVMEQEPIKVVFLYGEGGKISLAPWQGERRLSARWNLVPPPRHESAEA